MRIFLFITCLALWFSSFNSLAAPTPQSLRLGEVHFPTSTTVPAAQTHFELGVTYLHNFMYPLALREFKLAQVADANFMLAYWGQMMAYNWSLWSYTDRGKAQQVLKEFALRHPGRVTPLEAGLMAAVRELYGPGSVASNSMRYLQAMRKLYRAYPQNVEVASLYALSLIAYTLNCPYEAQGAQLLAEARAVLKPLIKTHPRHPGVLHYYTHANDIPNSPYLKQGLVVAPGIDLYLADSSHVLHMPAHMYSAMGMWPQAIAANQRSIQASHTLCRFQEAHKIALSGEVALLDRLWTESERYSCDAANIYHSLEWLQYGFLQMGDFEQAQHTLDEIKEVAAKEKAISYLFWVYRMQARQTLATENYARVEALPRPLIEQAEDKNWAAYSECGLLLADGIAAVQFKQLDMLKLIDYRYGSIIAKLKAKASEGYKDACILARTEVAAYRHARLEHDYQTCSNELDAVEALQVKLQSSHESLTLPFLPAQEAYGKLMRGQKGYRGKIRSLYEDELKYYPQRREALGGLRNLEEDSRI